MAIGYAKKTTTKKAPVKKTPAEERTHNNGLMEKDPDVNPKAKRSIKGKK